MSELDLATCSKIAHMLAITSRSWAFHWSFSVVSCVGWTQLASFRVLYCMKNYWRVEDTYLLYINELKIISSGGGIGTLY